MSQKYARATVVMQLYCQPELAEQVATIVEEQQSIHAKADSDDDRKPNRNSVIQQLIQLGIIHYKKGKSLKAVALSS